MFSFRLIVNSAFVDENRLFVRSHDGKFFLIVVRLAREGSVFRIDLNSYLLLATVWERC